MTVGKDFRSASAFDPGKVDESGRFLGRSAYWKLYFVENAFRVITDSVLSAQIEDWWETVDLCIRQDAEKVKMDYLQNPEHSNPGNHMIYYVYLRPLGEIIRANAHIFRQVITNIDEWIVKIEQLRLPRNLVSHMNFPGKKDRDRIDAMYSECRSLMKELENLQDSGILELKIP
jgi:hypothetical protein